MTTARTRKRASTAGRPKPTAALKPGIRWDKPMIAREFCIDGKTVSKRLRLADMERQETYSTLEVFRAIYGDIQAEKLRLVREQADRVALENAAARREMLPAKEVLAVIERGVNALVQAVRAESNLDDECKRKILDHLRAVGEGVVAGHPGPETSAVVHDLGVG